MMDDEAAEKVARERRRDGARKKSAKTAAPGSLHDIDARSRRMIQDFIRTHNIRRGLVQGGRRERGAAGGRGKAGDVDFSLSKFLIKN